MPGQFTACTYVPNEISNDAFSVSSPATEQRSGLGLGTIDNSDLLSVAPQMQAANRGLTIKQYQPAIQPISVTPAATIQPIATVVTGSNVKDDYESESTFFGDNPLLHRLRQYCAFNVLTPRN